MRRRLGSALRIGLSTTGAAVATTSGWPRVHGAITAEFDLADEADATPERVLSGLGALLDDAQCSRLPARIILDDNWVRRFMVVPPANAASLADCRAAAEVRFATLFGEAPADWQLAADWSAREPFLACAAPRALLAALQQVARGQRLALLEIAPQSVVAWNRFRRDIAPGAWFGLLHRQALMLAVPNENGLDAIREVALPAPALKSQSLLPEILLREALRMNLPMPSEIRLCGQVPPHWAMQKTGELAFVRLDAPFAGAPRSAAAELALTGITP
jgi:hypothetical protein